MADITAELRHASSRADRLRAEASREMRNAAARAARAGWSQRRIAGAMGRSQPEISRLLSASSATDAEGRPRRWMTARSAADAISKYLSSGDETTAFKMAVQSLDHLRTLKDPEDVAEWEVEPAPISDPRFDTLLRALAARTLRDLGRPVPGWTQMLTPLAQEWVIPRAPSRRLLAKREGPRDLAALNIFLTENDLATL